MADYTIEHCKCKKKNKIVRNREYTYDDLTNVQIVILSVMWVAISFVIVSKFFFANIAVMNLLQYVAYAFFLVLAIAYIVKMAEKKDAKRYFVESEGKTRIANAFFGLAIIVFISPIEIGLFDDVVVGLIGWFSMIRPVIKQYTTTEEEYIQVSVLVLSLIAFVTATQIAGFVSGEDADLGTSWLWLRRFVSSG